MGRFRLVTLNIRCDLIRSQSNHGRRWGKRLRAAWSLGGLWWQFSVQAKTELKLQDSVRSSTNKGLHYVMHLVFLCELVHNKVSLVPHPPRHFTTSRLQLIVQKGNFLPQIKSLNCKKTDIFP